MTTEAPSSEDASSFVLPIVTAALAVAIFVGDSIADRNISVATLYVVVVLMAARFCQLRGILLVAAGCAGLTASSFFLSPLPASGSLWEGIANTLLSLTAIGLSAFVVARGRSADSRLREQANLLDLTHDTLFSRSMAGVITYWNRAAEELYGWKRAEAIGKLAHELLEKSPSIPLAELEAELLRTGRWEGEVGHKKRDGTLVVVASRWSLRRDAAGRPVAILETNNDITERKRAEEDLRRSEAYLAGAQKLSHTGSFGWSPSSGNIWWSEESYRILEHDRARPPTVELVLQRTHPEDRVLLQQAIDRAQRERKDFDIEHRALMPDGSVKYLKIVAHASTGVSGTLEFVGAVMDVTERKRAEQALRRSEAYLAEAQRLSHTGSWAWNVATRELLHWSEEQYRVHGLDPDKGMPSWEGARQGLHPEDRARCLDTIERAIRERADCELDYRFLLADGTIRFIHAAGHPLFDAHGDLVEFLEIEMDVTERKRAEYLIAQVFERSPDGISIVDRGYRYRRVNPVYEQNWKMPADRFVGMRVADLLGLEAFEQTVKPILDRCFAGEEVSYAAWFTNEFGRRYLALSYSPLRPDSEQVEAALVITRDLTEHKLASESLQQAQAELARVNRMMLLGEMAASIAHEVNQPITAVVANASACLRWLAAQPPAMEEARQALGRVVKNGTRAGEVISRIRGLVKKVPPQREALDVNGAILEVVALTQSEVQRNRVKLQTRLSNDLPLVPADRVQLQQVILNLIMNAVEAMGGPDDRPRELVVGSGRSGSNEVLVEVRDSGQGFDATNLDRLFDSFYTTKPEGMGMGLAISRSIVEAHGGRLWATPNEPHGAVFRFTLPVADEAPAGLASSIN